MSTPLCPYCRKAPPSEERTVRPFCSQRCKDLDLGNWLNGTYRIAGERAANGSLEENNSEISESYDEGDE